MFVFTDNKGCVYRTSFKHSNHQDNSRWTDCNVFDSSGEHVAYGSACCHAKDNFNKRVGRKLAFKRAMDFLRNTIGGDFKLAAFRGSVWQKYWESFPNDLGKL